MPDTNRYALVQWGSRVELAVEKRKNAKLKVGGVFPSKPATPEPWYIIKVFDQSEQHRIRKLIRNIGQDETRSLFSARVLEAA